MVDLKKISIKFILSDATCFDFARQAYSEFLMKRNSTQDAGMLDEIALICIFYR